jgi:hypothetical protein
MDGGNLVPIIGVFIPIVAIVSMFTFISIAIWLGNRRRERDAFYKSETLRRITEAGGEGAKAAIELMREDERLKEIKRREGLKIGGVINVGLGIGLMIFLHALLGGGGGSVTNGATGSVYLCGLIPGLIGVAMLVYVYFMAAPVEQGPKA